MRSFNKLLLVNDIGGKSGIKRLHLTVIGALSVTYNSLFVLSPISSKYYKERTKCDPHINQYYYEWWLHLDVNWFFRKNLIICFETYRQVVKSLRGLTSCFLNVLSVFTFCHSVHPKIVSTNPITKTVVLNESQPFSLSCMASGKPTPTLVWSKTSGSSLQFPDGTTLTVSNASSEHSGTYQCTATNKAGSDTATFVVVVGCK